MAKNKDQITVYPAYAGVILCAETFISIIKSLSRIRGGDPRLIYMQDTVTKFIPHTRG